MQKAAAELFAAAFRLSVLRRSAMAAEKRHPLPASEEARGEEIPESFETEKDLGDDPAEAVQPAAQPVTPEGENYDGAPGR
jgi:hypothetical protein